MKLDYATPWSRRREPRPDFWMGVLICLLAGALGWDLLALYYLVFGGG